MAKAWCYISTSNGYKVKIDSADRKKVDTHSWYVIIGNTGRKRVVTSVRTAKGVRQITLGRFLKKPPKGKQVYPRRFNQELDYRKDNLIVCTLKERQRMLPKKRTKSSSEFRGVSYSESAKKWRAGIQVNGKSINLGDFKTEGQAALAYNTAAKRYFGDSAYQNRVGDRKNLRRR